MYTAALSGSEAARGRWPADEQFGYVGKLCHRSLASMFPEVQVDAPGNVTDRKSVAEPQLMGLITERAQHTVVEVTDREAGAT